MTDPLAARPAPDAPRAAARPAAVAVQTIPGELASGPWSADLSAADLRTVFAALPGVHLLLAPDAPHYTMLAASDDRLAATLTTGEATVGRPLFEVFSDANPANAAPSGVANLRASLDAVLRTRAPHRMAVQRYDLRRSDGTWEVRHWAPRNIPVLGPGGEVRYLVHSVEEVTEQVALAAAAAAGEAARERLLAELEAERERLGAVIRHMPAPLALMEGPEHRFTLVNEAFKRVSGGGRDVTGLVPAEAFPELAGSGLFELHDRVYQTGEPWAGPETLVRYDRDGTGVQDTWFDLRFEPVRDAAVDGVPGRVVAILNFAVDVTEQVRARLEIQRLLVESEAARSAAEAARGEAEAARRAAEAANRAKADFLAVMSHELRTPLNAIGGYAQLMELGLQGPVTPEQLAALGRIQRGQQHLLGLINSVLNYAKLEAGRVEYETADVPAAEALAEVAALVAPQARAKGLEVAVATYDAGLVARADPEKVRQVLLNLLSNAIKFTRGGGTVRLGCRPAPDGKAPDGYVAFAVTDTGRGIAADQLARVFEPFVQVDQRLTRAQEGTGLGLAISRDLARGMGGDLTAESTPGVGSTFTLTLPAAASTAG